MESVNYKILKLTITKLIEEQHRGTWNDVLAKLKKSSKEEFLESIEQTDNLKDIIQDFCSVIGLKVRLFRDFYRFLVIHPSR